ncbi:hypothetical protein BJV78DRAFT_1234114 [Lactifluus subvellereus]|nr:hypothetical protein BJV78DRAFT_1234114 [Lactifluus subvellereus]
MAHCADRTDRLWCSVGHGAPPLGVVCRCPTEVLPGRERKFRSLVGKVSFGPHEAPLRECRVPLLSDQGVMVPLALICPANLKLPCMGRRLTDVD